MPLLTSPTKGKDMIEQDSVRFCKDHGWQDRCCDKQLDDEQTTAAFKAMAEAMFQAKREGTL